LRRTTGRRLQG